VPLNEHDEWRIRCVELAQRLGFSSKEVYGHWQEIWDLRMKFTKAQFRYVVDIDLAKELALRDIEIALDKRGNGEPS